MFDAVQRALYKAGYEIVRVDRDARIVHEDFRERRITGDWRIETCLRCDREQPLTWFASPDLWASVAGFDPPERGVLCPECFTDVAREQGRSIRWVPVEEPRP